MINLKIETSKKEKFYHDCYTNNINIYKIIENNNYLDLIVNEDDYKKIKKMWYVKIISKKNTGVNRYKNHPQILMPLLITIIVFIAGLIFFNNFIIDVHIIHESKALVNKLSVSLNDLGIKKNTFKKSYNEIKIIKEKILEEYKDSIEWLEIEPKGLKYIIRLEERKLSEKNQSSPYCDIYATKEGIIKKIIYEEGVALLEVNDYVHKGDIIISGDIKKDEELLKKVCARGKVYAEVWYMVNVSIPITKEERIRTGKKRYNLKIISPHFNDFIFKSRIKEYDEENKVLLKIFNTTIFLTKEYEITKNTVTYTNEEIINQALELSKQKINDELDEEEKIIYQKVLKKEENNSTMDIEVFISVLEQIGAVKEKE